MQATSQTVPYPPSQPSQNVYQQPLSETEYYALKRTYLGLLPPTQIIDICLTFDAYAPVHLRSTIWPFDIKNAVAALQQNPHASSPQPGSNGAGPSTNSAPKDVPPMASLRRSTPPPGCSTEGASLSEAGTSQPATVGPPSGETTSAGPSTVPMTAPHPPSAQPAYPHQPYGYPAYPHTPYYPPPPSHTSYPYPYSPYQHPFSPNPKSHQPPPYAIPPLPHAAQVEPAAAMPADDLPSYEEMIVEALMDSGDPEGCAPKSLFSWMAEHYPLQNNFRPSASQALQKAFKRGRLEKSSNGRYRLNSTWEGGSTSRKATRRPQTQAQTAAATPPQASSASRSLFTHAPLAHSHHPFALPPTLDPQLHPPIVPLSHYPGHPYGYPVYPHPLPYFAPPIIPAGPSHLDAETEEGSDAWEAAQNILKAINFGQLLQIPGEDGGAAIEEGSSVRHPSSLSASSGSLPVQGSGETLPVVQNNHVVPPTTGLTRDERAALQAHFALLAAQLSEIAEAGFDQRSGDLLPEMATAEGTPSSVSDADDGQEEEDLEMIEVPVPV